MQRVSTKNQHSFHIPVMGIAYTLDSPIRVAQYGISSVISLVDDEIMEKMREWYSNKFGLSFEAITTKIEDCRAHRITAYLNMVNSLVKSKFESFKEDLSKNNNTLHRFLKMLPSSSEIKQGLQQLCQKTDDITSSIKSFIDEHLSPGSIDVNIMAKLDREIFVKDKQLDAFHNDAHASLRGYGNSDLTSSLVLSAGMNQKLYSYMEEFEDFYPNEAGFIKKKIALKVSDFRSAMIQGTFLAKRGLWVSEFRIESGLNCGGHAFATDGLLMGPILEEFKAKKEVLKQSNFKILTDALTQKGKAIPQQALDIKITVQGGIGTASEHQFMISHYAVDSVGWGSPFLLVPEATAVDKDTRNLIAKGKEEDFYLSDISPLGVPFNTIKGTTNDKIKQERIDKERYGSSCPKKFLALNKEITPKGLCTASSKYQKIKIAELNEEKEYLSQDEYQKRKDKITEKACLCVGLGNAIYAEQDIPMKGEKQGIVICPGPNMAYFDKEVSLVEMVQHIYGTNNVLPDSRRPHVFINELKMYVDYLTKEINNFEGEVLKPQLKKWQTFKDNLLNGIAYYEVLFHEHHFSEAITARVFKELAGYKLQVCAIEIPQLSAPAQQAINTLKPVVV